MSQRDCRGFSCPWNVPVDPRANKARLHTFVNRFFWGQVVASPDSKALRVSLGHDALTNRVRSLYFPLVSTSTHACASSHLVHHDARDTARRWGDIAIPPWGDPMQTLNFTFGLESLREAGLRGDRVGVVHILYLHRTQGIGSHSSRL